MQTNFGRNNFLFIHIIHALLSLTRLGTSYCMTGQIGRLLIGVLFVDLPRLMRRSLHELRRRRVVVVRQTIMASDR